MIGGRRMMMGRGGGQPLTRLLVHFDSASMPPADARGGPYTVVDAGQSLTATDPKFGARCLLNGGGSGYFTPGPGMSFDSNEGQDWCLECWVKVAAYPDDAVTLFCALTDSSGLLYVPGVTLGTSLGSYNHLPTAFSSTNYFAGQALEQTTPFWQHVATYRLGDDLYVSVDGEVAAHPGYGIGFSLQNCTRLYVGFGAAYEGYPNYQGHIDCFRYSVGTSRYGASNFTPPAGPFTLD